MASGKDRRTYSTQDGEIHPSPGDNGDGASGSDGLNLSSVDQEIEEMRQMEEQEILPAAADAQSHEDPAAEATEFDKSEVDARSNYVRNVDYASMGEDFQQHFEDCGTVNRVTIPTDNFGHPKGYAYVEFLEVEAVRNALLLNDSELHGRQLKVHPKRTNVLGMNHPRGRRPLRRVRPHKYGPY